MKRYDSLTHVKPFVSENTPDNEHEIKSVPGVGVLSTLSHVMGVALAHSVLSRVSIIALTA